MRRLGEGTANLAVSERTSAVAEKPLVDGRDLVDQQRQVPVGFGQVRFASWDVLGRWRSSTSLAL